MNDREKFVYQCRQRAEELKVVLSEMKDRQTRQIIENIIRDYDRIADIQERLAKDKDAP